MPLPTMNIPNFLGISTPVNLANSGRQAAADSSAVALSNEDLAALTASRPVTGTFWQATQPVSIATMPSTPVTGTFWQATQPISGTVAATQSGTYNITNISGTVSLPTGAATAANQSTGNGYLSTIATAVSDTTTNSKIIMSLPYQAVAISQTAKVLGATGAIGDTLAGIIIQPTGTTVGSVIVYDNTTAVYTYPGGTVGADLRPIIVGMGMVCVGAGWHVTTPANATVLALGKFT